MVRTFLCLLVGASLLAALPLVAKGETPMLDRLFERLQATADPGEAEVLEALIWSVWFGYDGGDDEVLRLMQLGQQAMNGGDLQRAEDLYDGVIQRAPDFAEGWNRRATVRFLREDYDGSIADIGAVLEREPRHFGALSGLGLCYLSLGMPQKALAAFEAALAVHPHLASAQGHVEYLRTLLSGEPI